MFRFGVGSGVPRVQNFEMGMELSTFNIYVPYLHYVPGLILYQCLQSSNYLVMWDLNSITTSSNVCLKRRLNYGLEILKWGCFVQDYAHKFV